jgi:hypothetical protein
MEAPYSSETLTPITEPQGMKSHSTALFSLNLL